MLCTSVLFVILVIVFKVVESFFRGKRLTDLTNRHVLVTGCDSGFGYALVRQLDKLGIPVFAACLTEVGEININDTCSSRVTTLHLDVTDEDSIEDAVRIVKSKLKGRGLWGLVNNAGLQIISAPLELQNKFAIEKTLQVNLLGVIYVTKAFLPLLRKSKGRIVNISSDAALIAWPCRSIYNITKVGVESFASCIRKEMYYVGVTSHCVEPGAFKTKIIDINEMCSTLQKAYDNADLEVREFYCEGWLEKWKNTFRGISQRSDLSPVTDAVEHALFSSYPRSRYRCGLDCRFKFWPISLLPDWFQDWYYAMPAPDVAL